jgi:hypothetical protein
MALRALAPARAPSATAAHTADLRALPSRARRAAQTAAASRTPRVFAPAPERAAPTVRAPRASLASGDRRARTPALAAPTPRARTMALATCRLVSVPATHPRLVATTLGQHANRAARCIAPPSAPCPAPSMPRRVRRAAAAGRAGPGHAATAHHRRTKVPPLHLFVVQRAKR